MLAYAFILTHEGYPSVSWQDYYNWGPAQAHTLAASLRWFESTEIMRAAQRPYSTSRTTCTSCSATEKRDDRGNDDVRSALRRGPPLA